MVSVTVCPLQRTLAQRPLSGSSSCVPAARTVERLPRHLLIFVASSVQMQRWTWPCVLWQFFFSMDKKCFYTFPFFRALPFTKLKLYFLCASESFLPCLYLPHRVRWWALPFSKDLSQAEQSLPNLPSFLFKLEASQFSVCLLCHFHLEISSSKTFFQNILLKMRLHLLYSSSLNKFLIYSYPSQSFSCYHLSWAAYVHLFLSWIISFS